MTNENVSFLFTSRRSELTDQRVDIGIIAVIITNIAFVLIVNQCLFVFLFCLSFPTYFDFRCLNGFKIDGMFYNISDIFNWSPPQLEHFRTIYKLVYPGFFFFCCFLSAKHCSFGEKISSFIINK